MLHCALAMFTIKSPSLLNFEFQAHNDVMVKRNLKCLYSIQEVPSDETIRQCLDQVESSELESIFKRLFALAQRARLLEKYRVRGGPAISWRWTVHKPTTLTKVRCGGCCVKEHRDGLQSYYHHMVLGSLVHTERSRQALLPSGPEFIAKSDGSAKNDCERDTIRRDAICNAFDASIPSGRWWWSWMPHANDPMARMLHALGMNFVIVATETSQARAAYAIFGSISEAGSTTPPGSLCRRKI